MSHKVAPEPVQHSASKVFAHSLLPSEIYPGLVATDNNSGYMFTELSEVSREFIHFSRLCCKPIIDIGCAYGVATLPAIDNSCCHVIASDLSRKRLQGLRVQIKPEDKHRVSLVAGDFRKALRFPENSISAIHLSNVLHCFPGKDIGLMLKNFHRWLEPGGKLFINSLSIYAVVSMALVERYQQRKRSGARWPGEFYNADEYRPKHLQGNLHEFVHLFSLEDLQAILLKAGFEIDSADYFHLEDIPIKNTILESPDPRLLGEGGGLRTWNGIVVRKG